MKAGAAPNDTPIPCLPHSLGVTSLVMEAGGDEDEVIAALPHDLPEDHGGQLRLDEIRVQFGDRVADIVEGLSDHLGAKGTKGDWWVGAQTRLRGARGRGRSLNPAGVHGRQAPQHQVHHCRPRAGWG